MSARAPLLELTWAGFDAAVDVIAAQCSWRDRAGVHAASSDGVVLAMALADRLGLNVLELPGPGMLLVDAVSSAALVEKAAAWSDVEAWVWVDCSSAGQWPSVMKAMGRACLVFPWQRSCRREFVPGFDD